MKDDLFPRKSMSHFCNIVTPPLNSSVMFSFMARREDSIKTYTIYAMPSYALLITALCDLYTASSPFVNIMGIFSKLWNDEYAKTCKWLNIFN